MYNIYIRILFSTYSQEYRIRTVKAFSLSLLLHILILALIIWLLYITKQESSSAEHAMSLNLEAFVPDTQAPTFTTETLVDAAMPVAQEHAKNGESIEETTRKIFEKIIQAKNTPPPTQKQAKHKKTLLAKQAKEKKERERLAKKQALKEQLAKEKQLEESKNQKAALLAAAKKKQEMLAAMKAKAQEQERLAKEQEKQTVEETKNALMKQKIQKMNQEKRRQEKAQREALKREKLQKKAKLAAKEARKKQKQKEKLEKQKRKKEKLAKQKLEKQKLAKQQQKRALEKKLAQKRVAKKSTKGTSTKQHRSKNTNSGIGKATQQMIQKFYGDEFSHFTGTQQKFIEKNLGNIYIITQRVLSHKGYPFTAKQRHQQGIQLVTFYLHPNGHISKLRFLKRAKYKVLNDNTLKIIRQAHSTYPKPKTTTKITFFVVYTLH